MLQKRGGRTYLSPMICPYDSPAWQLASCRPTNTAKAHRQLCEYMPLRPCAISDLCKTCFTSREGGITAIYHCVFIHSALELCGYGGKVTIYLRNDKGNGENFFRGRVGMGNVKQRVDIEARLITDAAHNLRHYTQRVQS